MNQQRPLSPHLQVYKPQVTSVLSIFHRITGVALSFGLVLLVGWIFSLSLGESIFNYYSLFLESWLGLLVMFSFTFALNYHFCNGVRHLFWDAGYGYEISTVYKSGLAVVIISLSLTCTIWFFIVTNNV
ncbi:MAG: succinate dehydrogenase, cytochrome b556 subunit [SAR116 cluster bacterium]|nr:succinate dehydrogenase, cytochrome b556 subunit [SAR116 cluster bacterium]RPH11754.1 MAG: succinate dehydrogenase, cytochrome b556 subunit [Alphaproteobacteria bacterium TMED54]